MYVMIAFYKYLNPFMVETRVFINKLLQFRKSNESALCLTWVHALCTFPLPAICLILTFLFFNLILHNDL